MNRPSLQIDGVRIVRSGNLFKYARIEDEVWIELNEQHNVAHIVQTLKQTRFGADVFSFAQRLPHTDPQYRYYFERDSLAVVDTIDFHTWWKSLPQESRKNVRRAERRGVSVSVVEFNDRLVRGIKEIYDETRFRQGRRFLHFGKDLQAVAKENSSYLNRSQFLGASCKGELIGFMKIVFVDNTARIMQILTKIAALDKRPIYALIAKAVDLCAQRKISKLIYSQYYYGKQMDSPLTEFKRRNGFYNLTLPRFYVPLSPKGKLAIAIRAHRGLRDFIPSGVLTPLLRARAEIYQSLDR